MLTVQGASCAYPGGRTLFADLGFTLDQGQVLCVLGPNGVGKSTLLRCLTGLSDFTAGTVRLAGEAGIGRRRSLAGAIGFVPQSDHPVFAFDVRTVVEMGRAPHLSWTAMPGPADAAIVEQALARLGITRLAARLYPELSGGERQLVMIARALAQQPRLLVLDEPTSHLDFANQTGVLELVRGLADEGLAVVMTTHDPDHAFLIADQVLVLSHHDAAAVGSAVDVLTEARLSATYGRAVRLHAVDGRPMCFAEMRPKHARPQG
jgi:iron complex transport system ATP-binding protein